MWVTSDGVQHTIALPRPADVLTVRALASFGTLVATADPDALDLWLDDRLLELHTAGFPPDPDGTFVERVPDAEVLDGQLDSVEGLADALGSIDPRWQVDLLLALHDVVAEMRRQS